MSTQLMKFIPVVGLLTGLFWLGLIAVLLSKARQVPNKAERRDGGSADGRQNGSLKAA
jgi:hypothetical protein